MDQDIDKTHVKHIHFIIKCKFCKRVITQCTCKVENKSIEVAVCCDCSLKMRKLNEIL